MVMEKLRDRRLLCEYKFDEDEVQSYLYNMKLKSRMEDLKHTSESLPVGDARRFIDRNIVQAVRGQTNTLFAERIPALQKQLQDALKEMTGGKD